MPKVEGSFSTSEEPHFGHAAGADDEKVSFSNRASQPWHRYSKTGTPTLQADHYTPCRAARGGLYLASMSLENALAIVLSAPTSADLWQLRAELLERGTPAAAQVWPLLAEFHAFVDRLETATSSRDYSELASKLDISAVSGVILEHLVERGQPSEQALRLLSGIMSEGLMALATRQHVRAWEGELAAVYRGAAWTLYERLWRWTEQLKPELDPAERRQLLELLMAPIRSPDTSGIQKAVLIGRLFQILLLAQLVADVPGLDINRLTDPDGPEGGVRQCSRSR